LSVWAFSSLVKWLVNYFLSQFSYLTSHQLVGRLATCLLRLGRQPSVSVWTFCWHGRS